MLKRRDFLRATVVAAGALFVPGCGDDPEIVNPVQRDLEDGAAFFPQGLASGDPKPGSVILWARAYDEDRSSEDLELELQVSTAQDFSAVLELDEKAKTVVAQAKYDHCAKVRVTGLAAGTVYYYRFIYTKGEKHFVSPVGRTRTAPAPDADVPVRFAFVSCQDYVGRYYNSYVALAEEDIDFFVHLGDYIYETTGDPSFQSVTGRAVKFTDQAGAIALSSGEAEYFAAKSLDNYRELYKTYRSDKNLQKVHQLFPMIAVWDDHEYSNDCHGATAAYKNGAEDETDEARRKAANQAWFEYQPVDYAGGEDFAYDASVAYPNDITIYRDFVFGKHLHLVMTDLRTYRVDHVIPQDAFPGEVIVDQAALVEALGSVPEIARPYIDVDTYEGGLYKVALTALAEAGGYDPERVKGNISVPFINALAARANENLPPERQIPLIDESAQAALERGYAYLDLGKAGFYSPIGALYFVVKDAFDVHAKLRYDATEGASEDVMGAAQESWFLSTMQGSQATWKVWGNEFCLNQLAVDLTQFPLPEQFKRRFYINLEDWNGCRNKRSELIAKLAPIGNVVAITGDIHASYANTPPAEVDGLARIVEFVTPSIASAPLKSELQSQLALDPVLSQVPGSSILAGMVDELLTSKTARLNPFLAFANSGVNGYAVATVTGDELAVTMKLLPAEDVLEDYTDKAEELVKRIEEVKLRTLPGGSDLYREIEGAWKKWDAESMEWV